MTVLKALMLETALLECKQRNINTPEVTEASGFPGAAHPADLAVPQYRHERIKRGPESFVGRAAMTNATAVLV